MAEVHPRRDDPPFSEEIVVVAVGATLTLVVLFGYERSIGAGSNVEHARATALVMLVVATPLSPQR